MTRLLQRLTIPDLGIDPSKLGDVLAQLTVWDSFVEANRVDADVVGIPSEWRDLAAEYANAFPDDGRWIRKGLGRKPRWWKGGFLIGEAGYATHAITLDRDVFFNDARSDEPSVDTYVHELVHVGQFGDLGVAGFLGTYLKEFLQHWLEGQLSRSDTDPYHDIVHEKHARGVEERFVAWRERKAEAEERKAEVEKAEAAKREAQEQADLEQIRPRPVPTLRGFAIGASVGAGGRNRPDDVKRVAERLEQLGFGAATGDVASVTAAIRRYQGTVLAWRSPDGRVDPGGETLRALSEGRKSLGLRLPERR
jgi:hypothetical protein